MAKNENNLAFPVADSKGECLNGSEGLTKLEYAAIKILSGINASPFDMQEPEKVKRSIEMAKELFKQLEND